MNWVIVTLRRSHFFSMNKSIQKSILIAGTLLCLALFLIPHRESEAQLLMPFGGVVVDVDYVTCSCGFIIFTVHDISKNTEYRIIHFYVAQVLEKLGVDFGVMGAFIPRLYEYGTMTIPGYEPNVVGNFFPYPGAMCLVISTTGCSPVSPGAAGYLVGMGSSALPAF